MLEYPVVDNHPSPPPLLALLTLEALCIGQKDCMVEVHNQQQNRLYIPNYDPTSGKQTPYPGVVSCVGTGNE